MKRPIPTKGNGHIFILTETSFLLWGIINNIYVSETIVQASHVLIHPHYEHLIHEGI